MSLARRLFEPAKKEVAVRYEELHNSDFNELDSALGGIWVSKAEDKFGTACGKCREEERYKGFWWGNLKERDDLEGLDVG